MNLSPHVIRSVNGVEVRFGKLPPRERAAILRRVKAERKERLLANLQSVDIDKEQMLVELENFDDQPWGQVHWIDYLGTLDGQEHIVSLGWSKHNAGDPAPILDAIEAAEGSLLPLAAALCNIALESTSEDNAESLFPPRS